MKALMVRFGITSSPATRNLGLELVSRLARPVMGVWVRGIMLDMSDRAGFGLLRTRNRERVLEIRFSFRRIRLCRQQRNLTRDTIDLGFVPRQTDRADHRAPIPPREPRALSMPKLRPAPKPTPYNG
jgi:hypothetical protein